MTAELFMPADWEVPDGVYAGTTLRTGGVSEAPFASLNLGAHTDDCYAHVMRNRELIQKRLGLPQEPLWLQQTHGTSVVDADAFSGTTPPAGDAAITRCQNTVLAVLTADCLPVVLYAAGEPVLGVAHGGWRGLAAGILETVVAAMQVDPQDLTVWLGPAIGATCFEVGEEVLRQFVASDAQLADCFTKTANTRWMADLYDIARRQLARLGVARITGGDHCTYTDAQRFYSYRRDGVTGRMATLAWMT